MAFKTHTQQTKRARSSHARTAHKRAVSAPRFAARFSASTLLGLILGLSLAGYSVFAWAPPTAAPPGGNAEAPLNTSATAQSKLGDMGLGADPLAGYKLRVAGAFSANSIVGALGLTSGGGLTVSGGSQLTGNVGIGQASGVNPLEVAGNIAVSSSTADGSRLYLKSTGLIKDWAMNNINGAFRIFNGEGGTVPFKIEAASPNDTLYVNNAGRVGIGTPTPGAKLDVNGNAKIKGLDLVNNRIENVATPTTSPAAANKAYVDATVSAQAGGGGAACAVICNGGCPAPPSGWTLAQSSGFSGGFYVFSASAAAGRCAQQSGNSIYQGSETMCCYFPPSGIAGGGSGVGAGSTVIYYVPGERQGNLGGRGTPTTGADGICNANIPTGIQGEITNVHAFLSTASDDEIRDMHTADPDLDNVVKAWYEAGLPVYAYSRQRDAFEKIADNWTDLLDGSIDVTLTTADFPMNYWWSGSSANGSSNNTCNAWQDGTGSFQGNRGYTVTTGDSWLNQVSNVCNSSQYLLCAAKSGT